MRQNLARLFRRVPIAVQPRNSQHGWLFPAPDGLTLSTRRLREQDRDVLQRNAPVSMGAPNAGRLIAGDELEESSLVRVLPARAASDSRWGLPALVRLVERAARKVDQWAPRAVLTVGDLSRKHGGTREHRSHQSGARGRGFTCSRGASGGIRRVCAIRCQRKSRQKAGLRFDDAKLVACGGHADGSNGLNAAIFVASVRQRLLQEAGVATCRSPLSAGGGSDVAAPRCFLDDHFVESHVRAIKTVCAKTFLGWRRATEPPSDSVHLPGSCAARAWRHARTIRGAIRPSGDEAISSRWRISY
jgi:hypothetical protein